MEFTDQINCTIRLEEYPVRIVSLVPSQTELLHYLGLEDQVVGITKFCIHPDEWFRNKERVGGTKTVDLAKVKALQPDLIIANKEENVKEQVDELKKIAPVWVSDVNTLDEALDMIKSVGELTNTVEEAQNLIDSINAEFTKLYQSEKGDKRSAAYYIWNDPAMLAGKGTFIDDMLTRAGYTNIVELPRYPQESESLKRTPDVILLSSEPFPFREKHVKEFSSRFPNAEVVVVDGEMFSWYGSHLLKAPQYFRSLLHE